MSSVWDYSATPASNNAAPPAGMPEGMSPSSVNDAWRQSIACIFEGLAKSITAGGTADALTVTFANVPAAINTFADGIEIKVRAAAANATTAPTIAVNGGTARAITKLGGALLSPGDIAGNLHELTLRYNLANTRWELVTPAVAAGTDGAFKNAVIGGDFSVNPWQRGTSFVVPTGTTYGPDCFCFSRSGAGSTYVVSQVATSDPGFPLAMRFQRNAGDASVLPAFVGTSLESINCKRFQGRQVTLTVRGRKGANLSGTCTLRLVSGTGTDENFVTTNLTGQATVATLDLTTFSSSAVGNLSVAGTVAAGATQLCLLVTHIPTGTAGAADSVDFEIVQVEDSPVFTGFERLDRGAVLARCLDYFERWSASTRGLVGSGHCASATQLRVVASFARKRAAPTMTASGTAANFVLQFGGGTGAANALPTVAGAAPTPMCSGLQITVAAGLTTGQGGEMFLQNDAVIDWSAEL